MTTPPAGSVDPRRIGLYSTGSYWGGGGEQIDTLSGNLHFTIPLASPQSRTGWSVPVNLVYDSQNWRNDNGVNWKLGADVGFGFGWKLLIGSVTPYYTNYYGAADHFVYRDATGAEYRLDQNNSGIWTTSTQTAYVWLDTTVSPYRLHFPDGKFWVLGCTSGGTEQDAGTMYPTIIEDTSGNQVIIGYDSGTGLPQQSVIAIDYGVNPPQDIRAAGNTSSRITIIDDAQGIPWCPLCTPSTGARTYIFYYDSTHYAVPHLIMYANGRMVPESTSSVSYATVAQEPPFGSDPNFSGATTTFLTQATIGYAQPWQFAYDSAGAGEMQSVIFPFGGEIAWNYSSFAYTGNRSLREVSARYLAPDALHATSPMWSYGISRPDAPNSVTVHSGFTLSDASGVGAKTWTFNTTGSPWQIGLISDFKQLTAASGTVLHDDQYTWSQDPAGHPYISAHTSITDPGQSYQQSALTTQTVDKYGNVTQSVIYPYNNTTAPVKTYNNTYLSASNYTSNYVFNLLSTSTITPAGGSAITLATNYWDSYDYACPALTTTYYPPPAAPTQEYDANPPVPAGTRGLLNATQTPAKLSCTFYYAAGTVEGVTGSDGTNVTVSADAATNYAAPQTITAQSYTSTIGYTSWLGVSQTTGPNGDQLTMTYDSYGRPATGTSAYGGTTSYSYNTSAPYTQTETGADGVTITTLDGFGRTVLVQKGDSASADATTSYVQSVYAPCACSPLGKLQKVSMPYASGGSASAWTTYTYDGLGRTLSQQKPDGASTTYYNYAGNQTTVTDPAGKWKTTTTDVSGNLITVLEPDPANQPGGTLTTNYTYDWMGHVAQVSMPRGSTTQTRTFVYDNAGRLTSATNPENGTLTYTYNTTNTLATKKDAKGQTTVYTYDPNNRVTEVQRYPAGQTPPNGEDVCQRVTYTYDTAVNGIGRLAEVQYFGQNAGTTGGSECGQNNYFYYGSGYYPYAYDTYAEIYSYLPAGAVMSKSVSLTRAPGDGTQSSAGVEVYYTYDNAGRTLTTTYPMTFQNANSAQPVLTMGYDAMGRPSTLTDTAGDPGTYGSSAPTNWVSGLQYDYAGRQTGMTWIPGLASGYGTNSTSETRSYNVNGQLASLTWPYKYSGVEEVQYSYAATQNNGQITQEVDAYGYSGTAGSATTNYQYDPLKRLTSSALTQTGSTGITPWTQTYQYDGFGNLTAKVLNGTTTPITVNAATNQLTNAYYDANGNMTSGAGATFTYDEANRVATVTETSGGEAFYGYDSSNKRIYERGPTVTGSSENFIFYGAKGENLGQYSISTSGCYPFTFCFVPWQTNVWFGGRLVATTGWATTPPAIFQDRLGTNRAGATSSPYNTLPSWYYPYGEGGVGTDNIQFATYTRDSYSGIDYADQRFYASSYGRFLTPDRHTSAKGPMNPGGWNRYAYTRGDPVNRLDPTGRDDCDTDDESECYDDDYTPTCSDLATLAAMGLANATFGAIEEIVYAEDFDDGIGPSCQVAYPGSSQNGTGGAGSPSFALAAAAAARELTDIAGLFENNVSPLCDGDLTAVGVTNQQIVGAAQNANVQNGFATLTNYAQDVYANNPAAMAANMAIYGNETMLQYFGQNPSTAAVAQSPGNTIWLNAGLFNGMSLVQQEAMFLHELLHNITGNVDSVLQEALGLAVTPISENIGNKLELDCFGAQ